MRIRFLTSAALMALVLMSTACQSPGPEQRVSSPSDEAIHTRESELQALTDFSFSGGLGIWTEEQSIPARIQWQQSSAAFKLLLSGPMGIGDMRLEQADGWATLTRGNETVARGESTDDVVRRGLGLSAPVPVEALKHWVRGLPGDADSVERDTQGKLASLRYRDATGTRWQARFKGYTLFNGIQVPALITASGGPYSVRLVLKKWQMGAKSVVPEKKESNKRLPIPRR